MGIEQALPIIGLIAGRLLAGAGRGMAESAFAEKEQTARFERQMQAAGFKQAMDEGNWEAVASMARNKKFIGGNAGEPLAALAQMMMQQQAQQPGVPTYSGAGPAQGPLASMVGASPTAQPERPASPALTALFCIL